MHQILCLSLEDAQQLCATAMAAAKDHGVSVSIAVVDATTYPQAAVRMDGAPLMSAQGACDKARSAAEGGHPTTFFEKPLNEGRISMLKMPHTPVEGGVPVMIDGRCAGAVGVAGAPPHLDALIAETAIQAFITRKE